MYFHPKLAWPPVTDNAISRNHSNWPSLNLCQNLREVWANSLTENVRCWCFFLWEKTHKNLEGDGIPPPPRPVRPRVKSLQDVPLWSLMTIKFLLLRKYASPLSFSYWWSLLPKCARSNRNISQKWMKTEEWIGDKPWKCHICQLIYWPRDLPASFSLNILLRIYIFAAYLFRANLCKSILSSSIVQCQISNYSPFKQLSQFMNYL